MSQISFDRETAERLEAAYVTRDILRRRELVYEALKPEPGHLILDVGCGPGFYVAELLDRVGSSGAVTGIDRSAEMLAVTSRRCGERSNLVLKEGDATALPVADASFDGAVSVQVLEYVDDVDAALAELHRALRPGGRVVLWDVDWTTISWHSADPERMERALAAWDAHLTDPALPRMLAARLRGAGFAGVEAVPHAFASTDLSTDGYIGAIFPVIEEYLKGSAELPARDAEAWAVEQRELDIRGEFFFCCVQFCFAATKPA